MNEVIKEKLKDGPSIATYTSPEIQNNLLDITFREKISYAIQTVTFYSVLVDETKEVS